jgi:serine/threonine protein kinase
MGEGGMPSVGYSQPSPGTVVGPFTLLSVAGRGGCGTVWRAERCEPFRQVVAVKLIRPGMGSDAVLARFAHERQALARMDHPNIARVLDGGAMPDGQPYFVMEFVDGEPITAYCDRVGMPLRERALLLAQACDAVQHAHQRGVIHRDLKPSNILVAVGDDGSLHAKVIDFGIAKALSPDGGERAVTEVGEVVGTPEYMSPEQANLDGSDIDTRTDVWGLGAVLHELVCGVPPYGRAGGTGATDATQRGSTLRAARAGDVRRIATRADEVGAEDASARGCTRHELATALRGELGWIPMYAMRARPEDRYQSPAQLALDLRAWVAGGLLVAGPDSAAYRFRT